MKQSDGIAARLSSGTCLSLSRCVKKQGALKLKPSAPISGAKYCGTI